MKNLIPFLLNTPQALYLLFLIPLILLIHFFKTAYRHAELPALYLWEETLRRVRKRSILYKMLQNILPVLYVFIAFFLILAAAEPMFSTDKTGRVGVILDTSASMKILAGKGLRRYDLAFQRALDDLKRLDDRQVIVAGASKAVTKIFPITTDSEIAVSNLKTLSPDDSGDSIEETITRLLAQSEEPPELYIYTDHVIDKDRFGDKIHWIVFDQGQKNIGITNFSLRRNPANPGEVIILGRIKNFGRYRQPAIFKILKNEKIIYRREIEGDKIESISLSHSDDGPLFLKAVLEVKDDYRMDNIFWAYAPSNRPQRILLVDVTDSAVNKVFDILPNAKIFRVSYDQYRKLVETEYDLAVLENKKPKKNSTKSHIVILPPKQYTKISLSEPVEMENATHPLLSFVDFSDLVISEAAGTPPPDAVTVFLRSGNVPLIYLDSLHQALYLSFSPSETDFSQKPSFPVFFMNVVSFFQKARITRVTVGEPVIVPAAESIVTGPDGEEISDIQNRVFRPKAVGLYRMGDTISFLVVPDTKESVMWKSDTPEMTVIPPGKFWSSVIHWRTFALLAVLLLVFQWWYRKEKMHIRY